MNETTVLTKVVHAEDLTSRWRRIVIDASAVYERLLPYFEQQVDGAVVGAFHLWFYFPVFRADAATMPRISGKFAEMFAVDASVYGDPDVELLSRRMYTVRPADGDWRHLELNFAVHEHDGRGSNWAKQATVGTPLVMDTGGRVMDVDELPLGPTLLLLGDETGLPSIATMLERLPTGTDVRVHLEVADGDHEWPLTTEANATIEWAHRNGAEMGTTDFMRKYCETFAWPDDVYVWAAGEAREIYALRQHLRQTNGMTRENYKLMAFWRRGTSADRVLEVEGNLVNEGIAAGKTMMDVLAPLAAAVAGQNALDTTPFEYIPVDDDIVSAG